MQIIAGIIDTDTLDSSHQLYLDVPINLLHEFPIIQVDLSQILQFLHDFLVDLDQVLLPLAELIGFVDLIGEVLDF